MFFVVVSYVLCFCSVDFGKSTLTDRDKERLLMFPRLQEVNLSKASSLSRQSSWKKVLNGRLLSSFLYNVVSDSTICRVLRRGQMCLLWDDKEGPVSAPRLFASRDGLLTLLIDRATKEETLNPIFQSRPFTGRFGSYRNGFGFNVPYGARSVRGEDDVGKMRDRNSVWRFVLDNGNDVAAARCWHFVRLLGRVHRETLNEEFGANADFCVELCTMMRLVKKEANGDIVASDVTFIDEGNKNVITSPSVDDHDHDDNDAPVATKIGPYVGDSKSLAQVAPRVCLVGLVKLLLEAIQCLCRTHLNGYKLLEDFDANSINIIIANNRPTVDPMWCERLQRKVISPSASFSGERRDDCCFVRMMSSLIRHSSPLNNETLKANMENIIKAFFGNESVTSHHIHYELMVLQEKLQPDGQFTVTHVFNDNYK